MMDIAARLATLRKWYDIYDEFLSGIDLSCGKGCASCCTCNVTSTTLEGLVVYDHLVAEATVGDLQAKILTAPDDRFQPSVTLNQMVEMCVHDLTIPDETSNPGAGACLWLDQNVCPLYSGRPFGCRAMCSVDNCETSGEAQMPPLVLSANNVMMQYIEALDRPGCSGNLIDILHYLSQPDNHAAYIGGHASRFQLPLKPNLAFQVLMIPPEHRQEIGPLIEAMQEAAKQVS